MDIILASTSPRRRELFAFLGVPFSTTSSDAEEDFELGQSPFEVVEMLAARKADAVAAKRPDALVIGGDTVISVDGEILGKPSSHESALENLRRLRARTHSVLTGIALVSKEHEIRKTFVVETGVEFGEFSDDFALAYVRTGEPFDKAGGYGIQGHGALLVKSLSGSYHNVMGMPLYELGQALGAIVGNDKLLKKHQPLG